ncbi:hypothetical protein ACO0QE_003595 [Hanseniaspora vineae]
MIDWETRLATVSLSDASSEENCLSDASSIQKQTQYMRAREFFKRKVQQAKEEYLYQSSGDRLDSVTKDVVAQDENTELNNDKQINSDSDDQFDLSSILDCYSGKSMSSSGKTSRRVSRAFEYQDAEYVIFPESDGGNSGQDLRCLTNENDNHSATTAQAVLQTVFLESQNGVCTKERTCRQSSPVFCSCSLKEDSKISLNFPVGNFTTQSNSYFTLNLHKNVPIVSNIVNNSQTFSIIDKTDSSTYDTDSDISSVSPNAAFRQQHCINQTQPINESEYIRYRFPTGEGRLYSTYYDEDSNSNKNDCHATQHVNMAPLSKLPSPMSYANTSEEFESNIFDNEYHNKSNDTTNTTTPSMDDKSCSTNNDKLVCRKNIFKTKHKNLIALNNPDNVFHYQAIKQYTKDDDDDDDDYDRSFGMEQKKSTRFAHRLKQAFSRKSAARI